MTDDGRMKPGRYGHPSLSGRCSIPSAEVDAMCAGAPVVIPLVILNQDPMLAAWTAEVVTALRTGRIPRTYFSFRKQPHLTANDIISRLKDTLGTKNVSFSAVSVKRDRILICASFSRVITGSTAPEAA